MASWQSGSSDVTHCPKATGSMFQFLCSMVGSRYRVMGDPTGKSRGFLWRCVCWEGVCVRSGVTAAQGLQHVREGEEIKYL